MFRSLQSLLSIQEAIMSPCICTHACIHTQTHTHTWPLWVLSVLLQVRVLGSFSVLSVNEETHTEHQTELLIHWHMDKGRNIKCKPPGTKLCVWQQDLFGTGPSSVDSTKQTHGLQLKIPPPLVRFRRVLMNLCSITPAHVGDLPWPSGSSPSTGVHSTCSVQTAYNVTVWLPCSGRQ